MMGRKNDFWCWFGKIMALLCVETQPCGFGKPQPLIYPWGLQRAKAGQRFSPLPGPFMPPRCFFLFRVARPRRPQWRRGRRWSRAFRAQRWRNRAFPRPCPRRRAAPPRTPASWPWPRAAIAAPPWCAPWSTGSAYMSPAPPAARGSPRRWVSNRS